MEMRSNCGFSLASIRCLPRLLVGLCLGFSLAASADELRLPGFHDAVWKPLHFPKIQQHTLYDPMVLDDRSVLRATSKCSASALIAPVEDLDLARTPRLRWSWKIEQGISARLAERRKDGDDFAARVYVGFRFNSEGASTWERLKRHAVERIYGNELPGNTLSYVWSQNEPAGGSWPNPYTSASHMLSRGQGPLPEWKTESVNLLEDYRKSFGADPPEVMFVGIMTDSDNSCSQARAWFAEFRFGSDDEPSPE